MKGSALDTPMMRQYLAIKAQQPDAIVFYRMGDFYEMFLRDAELAAPLLDIALTTRDRGKPDAVPMCGIPVHSADAYIKKLAGLGHRVAICEQVENARSVAGRRLVRREVVEVVTPGLVGDPEGMEARCEVSVVALSIGEGSEESGLAALDASTGNFRAMQLSADGEARPSDLLLEELERISPTEILLPTDAAPVIRERLARRLRDVAVTSVPPETYEPARAPVEPEGFDAKATAPAMRAAAAVLSYLGVNQPSALDHAPRLRLYSLGEGMVLDAATRAHLALFENSEDRGRRDTLIDQLDATRTALGARRLARWLAYPLLDVEAIRVRQALVCSLVDDDRPRAQLREALAGVRDLERILARAVRPSAVPRDLGLLRGSLAALPGVRAALAAKDGVGGALNLDGAGAATLQPPVLLPDLLQRLAEGLVDDPPVVARGSRGAGDTGYIRAGFRPELDGIREGAAKGREWIAGLEARERELTGIATLKIRFHPVHGYSLEVTKSNLDRVPERFERKQTLANVERFTTRELLEVESQVMGANERAASIEREVFESLREDVVRAAPRVREAAGAVAELDALASLAEVARCQGWARPSVEESECIEIRSGRHPIVEAALAVGRADGFVPNDTDLDSDDAQILLLTGPNMSGKSTYLRQVAMIVLLAQVGSFVPAASARIGVVDRIFSRVGASDRMARGESTFMVEMRETAEILRQASRRSLIILDEIGRGTSTFDGLAIAWAVAEYLHDTRGLQARTLFATHYHELTDLARTKARVRNAHFEARSWQDEVVFLRRLVPGGANRSYGIQVARLAGLPDVVIARARRILANLESGELDPQGLPRLASGDGNAAAEAGQLTLFEGRRDPAVGPEEGEVLAELREFDPDRTTPLEALAVLDRLSKRLREGEC